MEQVIGLTSTSLPILRVDNSLNGGFESEVVVGQDKVEFSTDENYFYGLWGKEKKSGKWLAHCCSSAEDYFEYVLMNIESLILHGTEKDISISMQELWAINIEGVGMFYPQVDSVHYKQFTDYLVDQQKISYVKLGDAFVIHKFGNRFGRHTGIALTIENDKVYANLVSPPIIGVSTNNKFIYDTYNHRAELNLNSICLWGRPLSFRSNLLETFYHEKLPLILGNALDKGYIHQ